jgi:hypothetical protein
MKLIITWISLIAFLFVTLPAPVYASVPVDNSGGPEKPISEESVFPKSLKAYPMDEAVSVASTVGKIGVISAIIPFTNEFGKRFLFKVNFTNITWSIDDAGGTIAGGVLDTNQAEVLKSYALDKLQPPHLRNKNVATVLVIIGLIIAALSLGFDAVQYLDDLERAGNNARDRQNDCMAQMARDTSNAISQARSCDFKPERSTQSGSICWNVPEYNSPNPEICLGMTFSHCKRVCN